MAAAVYTCAIIGDGKSPDTAFRPAINDIKTAAGQPAFPQWHLSSECPVDPVTGAPTVATINVTVADNSNAALVQNNPQITPVATVQSGPVAS